MSISATPVYNTGMTYEKNIQNAELAKLEAEKMVSRENRTFLEKVQKNSVNSNVYEALSVMHLEPLARLRTAIPNIEKFKVKDRGIENQVLVNILAILEIWEESRTGGNAEVKKLKPNEEELIQKVDSKISEIKTLLG